MFQRGGESPRPAAVQNAPAFDFKRPNRISKNQVRAIHTLHARFVRSLAHDLASYLHTYVIMNLVSVEQIAYSEYLDGLPPSTFIVCLGMRPLEGSAVLEINPSLVFPILEMLLGGPGKPSALIQREVTEIEHHVMEEVMAIILKNLSEAWRPVEEITFLPQTVDSDRQFLQIISPAEPVVAVGIEARIGENSGLINLAMPSLIVKKMRNKLDRQWPLRKSTSSNDDADKMLRLVQPAQIKVDVMINGPKIRIDELLELKPQDVLVLDYPVTRSLECCCNGQPVLRSRLARSGHKTAARICDHEEPLS